VNVLVCVKRVPGAAGRVTLTDDGMAIDARHVGWVLSPHEESAVESAVRAVEADGGTATILTVGSEDALEQVRDALAMGAAAAVLVEAAADGWGPADVAHAIADVVAAADAAGSPYDLVLLGNEAGDTADFQVGIRLAERLGRPVVTGVRTFETKDGRLVVRRDGPDGTEVYDVPLPAVLTVREGGVVPRYPSVPGRIRAKKAPVERVAPTVQARGNGRLRLSVPPEETKAVEVLGRGPDAASAVVDLFERLGLVER
jgi:electron transfer flavoprotein beta subunit